MKTEPTEALEWLAKLPTYGIPEKYESIVRKAFSEGQSNPQIKKLEWTKNEYGLHWVTNNPFHFQATISEFNVRCSLRLPNQNFVTYHKNLDEAKQACQEDFEKRIKECLL